MCQPLDPEIIDINKFKSEMKEQYNLDLTVAIKNKSKHISDKNKPSEKDELVVENRLSDAQVAMLMEYPKLKAHFRHHLKQDIDYYFNEFIKKELTSEEKQELGLIDNET